MNTRIGIALILSLAGMLNAATAAEASAAAEEPYVVLVIRGADGTGIVHASADPADITTALGIGAPVALDGMRAFLESPDGLRPLVTQVGTAEDRLDVVLMLPEGIRDGRVRLYGPKAGPDAVAPALPDALPPLAVRREGGGVVVNNGYAEIVHDPANEGGLPSRVTFLASGAAFDKFDMHDRIYEGGTGQFFLRNDREAKVDVVLEGPLEVVVEVRARYVQGENWPQSQPRAVYRFAYRAGTPAVEVTARCEQNGSVLWPEHHLLQWQFDGRPMATWTGGTPRVNGTFDTDNQTTNAPEWGAVTDGTNVLGLISSQVKFYSGTGSYGSYIHGPWTGWDTPQYDVGCTFWADARPDALDRLEAYAATKTTGAKTRLTTPAIERALADVRGRVRAQGAGAFGYWLSYIDRSLLEPGRLRAGKAALDELAKALDASLDTGEVLSRVSTLAGGAGHVSSGQDGVIRMWGKADDGCSLLSMYDPVAGRELLAGTASPIWSIEAESTDGGTYHWDNLEGPFVASNEADQEPSRIVWRGEGEAAGITATVLIDEGALRLSIANDSKTVSINRVAFPRVAVGALGESAEDDTLFVPTVSGALAPQPLLKGVSCNAVYPSGWGSLPYLACYDGDGGIYVGAHDPYASLKHIRAGLVAGNTAVEMSIEWPAPDASVPGNDFSHPGWIHVEPFRGDWFDAARKYRAWVEAEAEWWPERGAWGRSDTPDWLEEVCVWGLCHGSREQAVAPVKKYAEFMGVPTAVHWYTWHEIPFDNNYPHYFPTKPGFAEGVAEMQAAGVRVMPYINGRLWDSDTDDFQTVAFPGVAKQRDGKPYIEHYGSNPQDLAPMCPTQAVWHNKVHEIVLRLVGPECNVDGVYIDQVAAANPVQCFDPSHGHPLGGGCWWTRDGYWPMLTSLQQTMAEKYPDKMLTTECNAEPYLHVFDGYLTWHFQYQNAVPAAAAVYGGKVQLFGRAYRSDDLLGHRMKTAQALVFGEQLGWCDVGFIEAQPKAGGYIRQCARIRAQLIDHLARGEMARPPKVSGEIPEVTGDWAWSGDWPITDSALQRGAWRAESGAVAFIFANSTDASLKFTWHCDAAAYGLKGSDIKMDIVREDGREPVDTVAASFDRPMVLEPATVQAFVLH